MEQEIPSVSVVIVEKQADRRCNPGAVPPTLQDEIRNRIYFTQTEEEVEYSDGLLYDYSTNGRFRKARALSFPRPLCIIHRVQFIEDFHDYFIIIIVYL